jgi:hypothetical protein
MNPGSLTSSESQPPYIHRDPLRGQSINQHTQQKIAPRSDSSLAELHIWCPLACFFTQLFSPWSLTGLWHWTPTLSRTSASLTNTRLVRASFNIPSYHILMFIANTKRLSGSTVGSCRRLLLGSTVGFYWDRPSALAGIDRRLLLGSTASGKVSSANGNCTRRFGAAERCTFSVFLIAI